MRHADTIIEAVGYLALWALVLICSGTGCRVASFEERRPDGTVIKGFGGSTFSNTSLDIERTPTTQRAKYGATSNAEQAVELLQAIK